MGKDKPAPKAPAAAPAVAEATTDVSDISIWKLTKFKIQSHWEKIRNLFLNDQNAGLLPCYIL